MDCCRLNPVMCRERSEPTQRGKINGAVRGAPGGNTKPAESVLQAACLGRAGDRGDSDSDQSVASTPGQKPSKRGALFQTIDNVI